MIKTREQNREFLAQILLEAQQHRARKHRKERKEKLKKRLAKVLRTISLADYVQATLKVIMR